MNEIEQKVYNRVRNNKIKKELDDDTKRSIKDRIEAGEKLAKKHNLDDIINTMKEKLDLGSYPTDLSRQKANQCLSRVLRPMSYSGEKQQLAQLNDKIKPGSYKKGTPEKNGINKAKKFIDGDTIKPNWVLKLYPGTVYPRINSNSNNNNNIVNACDFVACKNKKYYAVEMKSNRKRSVSYIEGWIYSIKNSNTGLIPLAVVDDKSLYKQDIQKNLLSLGEFKNEFFNEVAAEINKQKELYNFLWYIYSETGEYLLPDKLFGLADGGYINKGFTQRRKNIKKGLEDFKKTHKSWIDKGTEISNKKNHELIQRFFNY